MHTICRHFQSWKQTSQPKAAYRYTLKPAIFSSKAQLQRRHLSCFKKRVQSNIDPKSKRKDSLTHAVAPEPGDVYYTLDAEGPIYNDSIHAVIDSNSAQEYAVRSWLHHSPIT